MAVAAADVPTGPGAAAAGKYWAFISYSTSDRLWAEWLMQRLETYRVPKRLAGRASRDGTVPRRLYPIFRDRDELPTSSDLGQAIELALAASRYLVVVCSRRSAGSIWVDAEVRTYKRIGRANRILCVIVDGEPNATDRGRPGEECFCPALRHAVGPDGALTAERVEPLAADARAGMDGRAAALVKLLAGLLGVDYDELRRRERKRRIRRRIAAAAIVAVTLGAAAGGWMLQQYSWRHESLAAAHDALAMIAADRNDEAVRRLMQVAPEQADGSLRPFPVETAATLAFALQRNRLETVLAGMQRETDSLEFSPDGATILTASRDNAVRLWDARSGRRRLQLDHPRTDDRVWRAAFLQAGTRIVSGGTDGVLRVFRSADGAVLEPPSGFVHSSAVHALAAHEPSARFATGDAAGIVALWDARRMDLSARLAEPGPSINDLAFSRDGARLAAGADDGTVRVWDTATQRLLAVLRDPDAESALPFRRVRLNAAGNRVVAVGEGNAALLWDISDPAAPRLFRLAHERQVWFADFDPAGRLVATASADRTARLWDAATGRAAGAPMPHGHAVRHLAFSPDGHRLATASQDNAVRLWLADGTPLPGGVMRGHADYALLVAFDPAGARLASASSDMAVRVWRAEPEPPSLVLRGHSGPVRRARFDPAGRRIVTAGEDGRVILWNAATGAIVGEPLRFAVSAYSAEFDPKGERIVIALRDRTARIWDPRDNAQLILREHGGPVVHASFDPTGARVATVTFGGDNRLRIFDAATGAFSGLEAQEEPQKRALWSAVFHPDGKRVLVAAHAQQAFILPLDDPARRIVLRRDPARGTGGHDRSVVWASFDPAGRIAVTTSDDGTARLWDAASGRHLRALGPHEDFVLAAAFAPDGRRIATATRRGIVRFWTVADGELLAMRYVPGGAVIYSLDFARDGRSVLVALDDGTARILDTDLDPQKLLDRAAALMTRLSPAP